MKDTQKAKSLGSGQLFGYYVIVQELGSGGMGEVYLPDTRLDRKAALKVLPVGIAQNTKSR